MRGKKVSGVERRKKAEVDAKERAKIFGELCMHVRAGYSLESFPPLSDVTIKKWFTVYPEQFLEEDFAVAIREGREGWEKIGRQQSTGACLGNSRSWYYNMVNRYGWREKVDVTAEHKGQVNVSVVSYASTQTPQPIEGDE